MELCTNLQKKVLDLEKTKTTQANEIASLNRRVNKLEQKKRSRTHGLKRLRKVDEDITLVNDDFDKEMFDVDTLNGQRERNIEKPLKKKDQLKLDEEIAIKLQAEIDEEEIIAKAKEEKINEPNIALTEEWDDIQAKIKADHELAQRLQEELFIEEKAKLFQQLLEKRRKHFATKRAEEQRNKPPTQARQRKILFTYLKNITDLVESSSKREGEKLE
ncbi:hypothetical protein Tco_1560239 [Tanacetum coccineum]